MTALSDELNNDPAGMGYAALITAADVRGIEAQINALDKATISRTTITRDEFLMVIVPGMGNLLTADPAVQGNYSAALPDGLDVTLGIKYRMRINADKAGVKSSWFLPVSVARRTA